MRTILMSAGLVALAACGGPAEPPAPPALAMTLTGSMTATPDDDDVCLLPMTVENRLGRDAVNVQIAYTARTDGQGTISEYIRIGDFAAGETRQGRMFVSAPCEVLTDLKLARAVCTIPLENGEIESCADAVTLDGGGIVEIRTD